MENTEGLSVAHLKCAADFSLYKMTKKTRKETRKDYKLTMNDVGSILITEQPIARSKNKTTF